VSGSRRPSAIVTRHAGDAYDKGFRSWDRLVALIFAQFSTATSLRGLEHLLHGDDHFVAPFQAFEFVDRQHHQLVASVIADRHRFAQGGFLKLLRATLQLTAARGASTFGHPMGMGCPRNCPMG